MAEEYVNDYVVNVASGHPGYTSYTIICTPEKMGEMLDGVRAALEAAMKEPTESIEPQKVWSTYATKANEETSRVYLQFAVVTDLKKYHVIDPSNRATNGFLSCGIVLLLLIGAGTVLYLFSNFAHP